MYGVLVRQMCETNRRAGFGPKNWELGGRPGPHRVRPEARRRAGALVHGGRRRPCASRRSQEQVRISGCCSSSSPSTSPSCPSAPPPPPPLSPHPHSPPQLRQNLSPRPETRFTTRSTQPTRQAVRELSSPSNTAPQHPSIPCSRISAVNSMQPRMRRTRGYDPRDTLRVKSESAGTTGRRKTTHSKEGRSRRRSQRR
ncbi:hypothetical protein C8R46DRAFT_673318 [Mycena filopes]|nr:hypothetical protein C8R46DRAFT_673318 [Mycena filopes]